MESLGYSEPGGPRPLPDIKRQVIESHNKEPLEEFKLGTEKDTFFTLTGRLTLYHVNVGAYLQSCVLP